jgi:quinol monooxygenase YgiN
MIPKMVSCTIRMIEDWENASEIDAHKEFVDLTASIIAQTAFESTPALGKRVAKLQREQNLNIQKALRSVYIPGMR